MGLPTHPAVFNQYHFQPALLHRPLPGVAPRTGRAGVLEHGQSLTAGLSVRAGPLGAFQKVLRPAWGSMIMGWDGAPETSVSRGCPPGIGREPGGSAWARAWGPDP